MILSTMDAHPVPQDVNSFQFRLIGDMTIKQFTYLASGLGIAYMLYVFIAASSPTPPTPEAEDLKELVETAKRAQLIQSQIVQTEHQLTTIKSQASSGQH